MKIELSQHEIAALVDELGERPYNVAAPLINTLVQQANAHTQRQQIMAERRAVRRKERLEAALSPATPPPCSGRKR